MIHVDVTTYIKDILLGLAGSAILSAGIAGFCRPGTILLTESKDSSPYRITIHYALLNGMSFCWATLALGYEAVLAPLWHWPINLWVELVIFGLIAIGLTYLISTLSYRWWQHRQVKTQEPN